MAEWIPALSRWLPTDEDMQPLADRINDLIAARNKILIIQQSNLSDEARKMGHIGLFIPPTAAELKGQQGTPPVDAAYAARWVEHVTNRVTRRLDAAGIQYEWQEVAIYVGTELLEPVSFGPRATRVAAGLVPWQQHALVVVGNENNVARAFPDRLLPGEQLGALIASLQGQVNERGEPLFPPELIEALGTPQLAAPGVQKQALRMLREWEQNNDVYMDSAARAVISRGGINERFPAPGNLTQEFNNLLDDPKEQEALRQNQGPFAALFKGLTEEMRAKVRSAIQSRYTSNDPKAIVTQALADAGIIVPESINQSSTNEEKGDFQARQQLIDDLFQLNATTVDANPGITAEALITILAEEAIQRVGDRPVTTQGPDGPVSTDTSALLAEGSRRTADLDAEDDEKARQDALPSTATKIFASFGYSPAEFNDGQKAQIALWLQTVGTEEALFNTGRVIEEWRTNTAADKFLAKSPEAQMRILEDMLREQLGVGSFTNLEFQDHIKTNVLSRMLPAYRAALRNDPTLINQGPTFLRRQLGVLRPDLDTPRPPAPTIVESESGPELTGQGAFTKDLLERDLAGAAFPYTEDEFTDVASFDPTGRQLFRPRFIQAHTAAGGQLPGPVSRGGGGRGGNFTSTDEEIFDFATQVAGADFVYRDFLVDEIASRRQEFSDIAQKRVFAEREKRQRPGIGGPRASGVIGGPRAPGATGPVLTPEQRMAYLSQFPIRDIPFVDIASGFVDEFRSSFEQSPPFLQQQQREAEQARQQQEREAEAMSQSALRRPRSRTVAAR
jgi:hypothetical protein